MKKLLKEILEDIKPSKEDEKNVRDRVNSVLDIIKKGLNAKVILGGSGAKGTWLKTFDADIFVKFDYKKYKGKRISDILETHLKKNFKIERLHGSRDYFRIKEKDFFFEIVPILNIKKANQAENITDISPLHSVYVNKFNFQDDIRLMKQFCKAQRVYGAESYKTGFSGYVCELLVIHYKGFEKLIKKAAKWKAKVVVDPKGYYKGKNVVMEMNKSKLTSPLILVDPVQKERNAAAALSEEKFDIFVKACKDFLKNPDKKFFYEKEIDLTDLKGSVVLEIEPLKGKEDVIGAKIVKVMNFINQKLKQNDFVLIDKDWQWNKKILMWFRVKGKLGKFKDVSGPPVKLKNHVKVFKKKYKKTFTKGNRVYARIERKYKDANDLLKDLLKDKYVKERVKKIKLLS